MNELPIARHKNIIVQEFSNEVLIYDLLTHKAYSLNETSSIVYQACDGKTSFEELRTRSHFPDEIIYLALDELKKENLIEGDNSYISPFDGMSRREAIGKAGLASIIALPVISFLIAPTTAMAASGGSACGGTINPNMATGGGCNFVCSGPHTASFCNQIYCGTPEVKNLCKSCSAGARAAPVPGGPCNFNCFCN